jgi:heme/copper-type cytochrome/quinol oxidase subunit 3
MAFAGLIGVYLATRAATIERTGTWLPAETLIPLTPANMILVTFALSVVTMYWAVWSVGKNDRPHAYLALGITILFGACVINATTFLYSQMNLGIRDSTAAVLIYVITAAHLAMVVAALVFAALMTFRTLGGQYAGRDKEGIAAAAMCWYATFAVYAVIWLAIYVTK